MVMTLENIYLKIDMFGWYFTMVLFTMNAMCMVDIVVITAIFHDIQFVIVGYT